MAKERQDKGQAKIQIGKKGLTKNVKTAVENAFNTREKVKIKVLKSATRDQDEVENMAEEIIVQLGEEYEYTTRGFTINLEKQE